MTNLYITRHGETIWNTQKRFQGWGNSELTSLGEMQGKNLNKIIEKYKIDVIYTSPLKRAFITANYAKGDYDIPLYVLEDLKELNLGDWEGKTYKELEEKERENFENYWNTPSKYIPRNGESYDDLIVRCKNAIEHILEDSLGKNILIVTHGMTLMTLIHVLTNENLDKILKEDVPMQTSITHIEVTDSGVFNMKLKGDTSHYSEEWLKK